MVNTTNVDIVIRTTAEGTRRQQLFRAIDSIKTQKQVNATPIVVVNGNRYDKKLFNELEDRNDIRFMYIEKASVGKAMLIGRKLVVSDFFGFLDDDDEYLENALLTRLTPMLKDDSIDLVVTNGYMENNGTREIQIPNISEHQGNALEGIMARCWLASCGGLFRSSSITTDYFDGTTDFQELTLLAFKIAVSKKNILFIDKQTYVVHSTPRSASKSFMHIEKSVAILEKMAQYNMPRAARKKLLIKYRNRLHVLAGECLKRGEYKMAWKLHLKSLIPPYTLKYLFYTRKLIFPKLLSSLKNLP